MKRFPPLIEIAGWYGALAILLAYGLASFSILKTTDWVYQLLNASGALGILGTSLQRRAYQPAFLNGIWAVVAIIGLITILF